MKALTLVVLCLTVSACVNGYHPRYPYSNIEVANLTGDTIRNVKVHIGPDGRTLECAEVTKNRLCQERFGKRVYPQGEIHLSWVSSDGEPMSAKMTPPIPATFAPSLSLRVMMDIAADGSVKFYFQQDDQYL